MKISTEISLYPLTPDYETPILAFITRLRPQPSLTVATNPLSTQVVGEYDAVMDGLKAAMQPTLAGATACSFVLKILNVAIEPGATVAI